MKTLLLLLLALSALISSAYQQATGLTVQIVTSNGNQTMVSNGQPVDGFTRTLNTFDCSLTYLYTYTQSDQQYNLNTPYYLVLQGYTAPTSIQITTVHHNFQPTYNTSFCSPPSCQLTIQNNCPSSITFFNYFDRILLNISGFDTQLTYYVKCNNQFVQNTFEWGLVIEIVVICILVTVVALYSKAWSLGGRGVKFNVWFVVAASVVLIGGATIGYFSDYAINVCLIVLSFILGILGVAVCVNQLLFLLRTKCLMFKFFSIGSLQFRLLQLVSLSIGALASVGWWFSDYNMIVNDAICLCITVAAIKILKFTSLKMAGLAFLVTITLELTFATALYLTTGISYNTLFLNQYNYPFELQIPTINPVYNQKCAWLPFTAIVFPGMLFSYLRRFDSSRSTNLYLLTASATFLLGGIAWMFLSIASPVDFPFGLVSEPCMFGLVCLFAYRRREMRVLWDGKFYDQQFGDREDMQYVLEMMAVENRDSVKTIDSRLIEQLKERNASIAQSNDETIRSKFLREMSPK